MKKIMILGGGENQVSLIRRAKKLGLNVVLCDFRDNVPGIALADVHYQVDTLTPSLLIDVGRRERIDGIATNSEPAFMSMAIAAEALGLRCLSKEHTELFKNKYLMREFCMARGIPTPAFKSCNNETEAILFFRELGRKCIIKPLDNSASRGVYSINSEDDLRMHFAESMAANKTKNAAVLIEEYISGTEFTIDGIMTPRGHRCLAISEKKHYPYNENVACELRFENFNEEFDYALLRKTNDRLCDAIGAPFAVTHAEYKFSDDRFNLIEIQARGGGNFIATDIAPYISGVDEYTELIKWCVGMEGLGTYEYECLSGRCAVLHFFDIPEKEGVVSDVSGIDYFKSLGDRIRYELGFKVGDRIVRTRDDSTRIGWYIYKARNRDELTATMQVVDRKFKIGIRG